MYFGHASWIAVVIFGGTLAIRYLSSQRHRGNHPGSPTSQSSLTDADRAGPGAAPTTHSHGRDDARSFGGTPPGWFIDPSGQHEQRYWSGSAWTEHVTDNGVPGADPPPQSSNEQPR
jgi:hypothetical protein